MHMVHQNYDGDRLLVLAIFFDVESGGDKENEFIASLKPEEEDPIVDHVKLEELLKGMTFENLYTY